MKKLFFLLGFVCCLGFMSSAQQTVFLQDADAIEVLKDTQMQMQPVSLASDASSDFVLSGLKHAALAGMVTEIIENGNSAQTVEAYFSQSEFTDARLSSSHLEETKSFILSLITKSE